MVALYGPFFVGSRVSISGGGSDRKKFSSRIAGSNFEGGTGPKSNLTYRIGPNIFFVGSRVSMSGGGIGPKCGFVVSILFFLKGNKLTLFSHVPYSWGVEGAMFSDPGSSL